MSLYEKDKENKWNKIKNNTEQILQMYIDECNFVWLWIPILHQCATPTKDKIYIISLSPPTEDMRIQELLHDAQDLTFPNLYR